MESGSTPVLTTHKQTRRQIERPKDEAVAEKPKAKPENDLRDLLQEKLQQLESGPQVAVQDASKGANAKVE